MPETLTLDKLTPQQLKIFWNEVARKSTLHEFLYNFLGFKDLNSIHKDLCQFLETKHLFKLILMPRYTFKSSICTIGKTLHELNKDSNQRILIYSDASDKATGFLTSIKGHIEGKAEGSKFYAIYNWGQKDPKQTWNLSEIVIADRKTAYPEASIETAGIETSKVGKHYDGIIFDDIVSDKNVTTKDQMDKVENCFRTALSLLKPDGWVIITGTIWHFGDLYRRIIADNELSGLFQIFIVDGEDDPKYGKYCFSDIGLTKEFLEQKKKQQGTYLYSCLYRNNPVSPESAIFKESNFSFYGAIKPDDLYITGTLDPAGEGKDKSGLTAVGTDYEMNMNILEALEGHWKPSELIDLIINLHYKLKFKIFGLETIFFRRMLKLELMRRIGEEHKDNPTKFPLFGIYEFDSASRQG
nr:hypothetical protein [Bacteroidota bacterium]